MHIALFVRSFGGSGGAERVMLNIARGLNDKGHRVDLVMGRYEGHYLDEIPASVRIVNLAVRSALQALASLTHVRGNTVALAKMVLAPKPHWVLGAIPGLACYLTSERPQALISAMDYPNVAAILARDIAHVSTRIIVTVHSTLSAEVVNKKQKRRVKAQPKVVRRFYPQSDAIVAVSKGVAKDLAKVINLSPDRITTIYNPVVTPEIDDRAREYASRWFFPGAPPVILGVGGLKPAKDFPTLLSAFARVRSMMKARLIILGEGKQRGKLLKQAKNLGIYNDLNMPGFVENPFSYMAKASVFVLSSVWEGLPTVLIEALACGCPVVSTDCPSGPAEILKNGRFGTLVPVGNDAALAEAILNCIKNPPDRHILMARGREFSIEQGTRHYLSLVKHLCSR